MLTSLIEMITLRSSSNIVTLNERGMVTIPLEIRKKFNLKKGSKAIIMEIDGNIEIIPLRTVEEMEAACTISRERMAQIYDESHDQELKLENDGQSPIPKGMGLHRETQE